jgi:hypothetical protein
MVLTINKLNDGRISIPFTREEGVQSYSDAIVLSEKEYEQLTEEQIVAMMDYRFNKWYQMITYGIDIESKVALEDQSTNTDNTDPLANTDNTVV